MEGYNNMRITKQITLMKKIEELTNLYILEGMSQVNAGKKALTKATSLLLKGKI